MKHSTTASDVIDPGAILFLALIIVEGPFTYTLILAKCNSKTTLSFATEIIIEIKQFNFGRKA